MKDLYNGLSEVNHEKANNSVKRTGERFEEVLHPGAEKARKDAQHHLLFKTCKLKPQ